jgi:hypothetical protein
MKHPLIRDQRYRLRVADSTFLVGNAHDTGALFAKLSGRDFLRHASPIATHQSWLRATERNSVTQLPEGESIELISPEGKILQKSAIGASLIN